MSKFCLENPSEFQLASKHIGAKIKLKLSQFPQQFCGYTLLSESLVEYPSPTYKHCLKPPVVLDSSPFYKFRFQRSKQQRKQCRRQKFIRSMFFRLQFRLNKVFFIRWFCLRPPVSLAPRWQRRTTPPGPLDTIKWMRFEVGETYWMREKTNYSREYYWRVYVQKYLPVYFKLHSFVQYRRCYDKIRYVTNLAKFSYEKWRFDVSG